MTLALLAVRDHRDRQAFGVLFDYFGPRLKAMLMRGGLGDGSAEDIVQDVMLAVWHKAVQFDPKRAEAATWIYRIARNRKIDTLRRAQVMAGAVLDPGPNADPDVADPTPDVVLTLGQSQEMRRLQDAMTRLKPEQDRAIRQAFIDELPHSQIAQATGLPMGTIKSRIRLGLERLRHELKDLNS